MKIRTPGFFICFHEVERASETSPSDEPRFGKTFLFHETAATEIAIGDRL